MNILYASLLYDTLRSMGTPMKTATTYYHDSSEIITPISRTMSRNIIKENDHGPAEREINVFLTPRLCQGIM